ncbi:MAG: hypothetical protein ABW110_06310 [Steroidobacteraceae bacterium]
MQSPTKMAVKILESFAFAQPLGVECYAPKVDVRHDPLVPEFDGTWERESLFEHAQTEMAAWHASMPDFRFEKISLAVDGDWIRVQLTLMGTLGTRLISVPVRQSYHIENGSIVGVEAWIDPTKIPDLVAAMQPVTPTAAGERAVQQHA